MQLRDAVEGDLPGILAIYNEVIANSTAIYTEKPVPLDDRLTWFKTRREQGYPVLVASDDTGILGFASFGDFRTWPCYLFTVEHSIHVRADRRGCGVGRALMEALIPRASALGKHVLVAGIEADNAASLRLHETLGFERTAHFREVGRKFNRWLDLVFMQRFLDAPGATRHLGPILEIKLGDLNDSRVVALLQSHLTAARAHTAPGSAHALDLKGLQSPDITLWTAWDKETPVAVGALKLLSDDHGEVKSMHTAPPARRRGVGTAMLQHIIGFAQSRGISRLSLETGSWDYFQPAVALYRKHGFAECPPFAAYAQDPNSIFMTLELRTR